MAYPTSDLWEGQVLAGHIDSPGFILTFAFPDADHRDVCWLAKDLGDLADRCLPREPRSPRDSDRPQPHTEGRPAPAEVD